MGEGPCVQETQRSSWLPASPGPALAVVDIWAVNQWTKDLSVPLPL